MHVSVAGRKHRFGLAQDLSAIPTATRLLLGLVSEQKIIMHERRSRLYLNFREEK